MCEMIGSISFSKRSRCCQNIQLIFLFIFLPIVLLFVTLLVGIILAFATYDGCLKYPLKKLINCIKKHREAKSKFIGGLQAIAGVVGLVILVPLYLALLIVIAVLSWALLFVVFTIPCIILYVIVCVRKQFVW